MVALREITRRRLAGRRKKSKSRSQKGEVPPGAETAEIEGWEPFAWKHNALRHSFISYRLAAIQNTAQVALEVEQSADDLPALPRADAADGRGEVVCGHVGEH